MHVLFVNICWKKVFFIYDYITQGSLTNKDQLNTYGHRYEKTISILQSILHVHVHVDTL